jgi:hypothetical protein
VLPVVVRAAIELPQFRRHGIAFTPDLGGKAGKKVKTLHQKNT